MGLDFTLFSCFELLLFHGLIIVVSGKGKILLLEVVGVVEDKIWVGTKVEGNLIWMVEDNIHNSAFVMGNPSQWPRLVIPPIRR